MKEDMLQRLHTLAVEHQLGEQYTRITSLPQGLSRLGILATGVGLVLLGGLAFLTPFLLTLLSSWQMLLLLSLTLTWLVTGLWLLLAPMRDPTSIEALLYTDGIVWKRQTTPEVLRWQDIESLWRAPTSTKKPHYAVHLYDERILTFDTRSMGAKKLIRILEWEMTCLHFAPLLKKFCQEQSLTFGPLCVNTQGISYNQKCLAWSQIKYMQHVNEQLIIRQKQHRDEEWAVLHITAIPNPTILEAIIRHIHHVHLENAYIQKYKEINDAETAS